MATMLTLAQISQFLKEQQGTVEIIDKYIQRTPLSTENTTQSKIYANFVMQHIFVNIRNSYQDGIFISQGLISNTPYYISTTLAHALRSAQEFLIDLAYIMSDRKNKKGNEYLRYLKFIVDRDTELGGKQTLSKKRYDEMFPPKLNLGRKSKTEWSHTSRKHKIEKGLKLYKIELPHFSDFRFEFHSRLSSTSHGNDNTLYTFTRTPKENLPKLEADLTISIAHFYTTLRSALKCYIQLYLGRNRDYREIVDSF